MLRFLVMAALLGPLLASCADGGAAPALGPAPASAELCVSSACGERIALMDIPSAENLIFSDDGRLFVSSGLGVSEITKDAEDNFVAQPVAPGCGSGLGLAIVGNTLYAVCSQMRLFAGALTATPTLVEVFAFEGMCIPNGMDAGPDGNLYVVDEPLNFCEPDPKIVRLTVDPADPQRILGQETWVQGSAAGQLHLGVGNVLRFPNGLQRVGNRFFGTDGGSIYAVDLLADGSAGAVLPLFFEPTAHDDLGIAGDALVVTDFFAGRLLLLSQDGEPLQETDPGLFSSPSSARLGRPPMFAPTDVLVTETGVLGDNNLPLDHLSVFRRRE